MKNNKNISVGISIGDLNGIGSEVILKTFEDNRMLEFCTPVLFASTKVVNYQRKTLKMNITYNGVENVDKIIPGKFNIVNVWKETPNIELGKETVDGGKYAILSLKAAVAALKKNKIDVLVTAPINKHNIQSDTFNFKGHTDFLAQEFNEESLMFMVSDELKVGLLTEHVALNEVVNSVTHETVVNRVDKMYQSLIKDFRIRKPKIALLGINPHAGDKGVIGTEDETILKPAIDQIKKEGKLIYGPYSADSFFGSGLYKNFDAVLAAFHDQGLIPFKTLAFGDGVNYTAGLSKIRTSPDHGTAYEIAGKGKANHKSFEEAVFKAIHIYKNRQEFKELNKNPLKKRP